MVSPGTTPGVAGLLAQQVASSPNSTAAHTVDPVLTPPRMIPRRTCTATIRLAPTES